LAERSTRQALRKPLAKEWDNIPALNAKAKRNFAGKEKHERGGNKPPLFLSL